MEWIKFFTIICFVPLFIIGFTSVCATEIDEAVARDTFPNKTCSRTKDCTVVVNGSLCVSGLCACPNTQPIFVNVTAEEGYCLESLNLTEKNCSYKQQCNYEHGACVDKTCVCEDRYIAKDNGNCGEITKNPLVPIIIGSVIAAAIVVTLIIYCVMTSKKDEN